MEENTIEHIFDCPCWVVDLLPRQVPAGRGGNYFGVEQYFLSAAENTILRRKFCNILLKLYCYYDFRLSTDGDNWTVQPSATQLVQAVNATIENGNDSSGNCYVLLPTVSTLFVIRNGDAYMTVYDASDDLIGLLRPLVCSEGLFIWMPPRESEE